MAETIRLDRLVAVRLGVDHDEAVGLIMSGRVFVGGMLEDKPGKPVRADAELVVKEKSRRYASRSGYKLEKALEVFKIDVFGLTACDIGASTGGFTDCLLQHGAAHVYAVDVAYGILAWELRGDERVTVIERTNARNLTAETLGEKCDIATVDVSFISLKKIFPAVDRILRPQGLCICLIKPQFEAARHHRQKRGAAQSRRPFPYPAVGREFGGGKQPVFWRNGHVSNTRHKRKYRVPCQIQPQQHFDTR